MELEKIPLSEWLNNPNTQPSGYEDKEYQDRFAKYCEKNGLGDKPMNIDEYDELVDKFENDWNDEEEEKIAEQDYKQIAEDMKTDHRSVDQMIDDDAIKTTDELIDTNDNGKIEKDEDEYELYDQMESMGDMPSDMQLHKALKKADTNDNGKIEKDEMADFQKALDDYACKNKKGRDDIPATYKR